MEPATIAALGAVGGAAIDFLSGQRAADKNYEAQKEFAQMGLRWKVDDAKAAGLHPLAALGASTTSFAPSYVGGSVGRDLAEAGQDYSRAVTATSSAGERRANDAVLLRLGVERAELENELLKARIAKERGQIGPPMPTVAQTFPVSPGGDIHTTALTSDSAGRGVVQIKPAEVTSRSSLVDFLEAGTRPGGVRYDFGPFGQWNLPSGQASEAMDDLDLAKYATIIGMNTDKFGPLVGPNISISELSKLSDYAKMKLLNYGHPKPAWVQRMEAAQGVPMVRDGKGWRFIDGRSPY